MGNGKKKPPVDDSAPILDLDSASVRGTTMEWHGQEEWTQDLKKEGFSDVYSKPTKPDPNPPAPSKKVVAKYKKAQPGAKLIKIPEKEIPKIVPRGARGYDSDDFGKELKMIFPGHSGPDLVGVDHKKKRILVGDITARSSTTGKMDEGGTKRRLPNDLEDEDFTRHHLEKTKRDAERLSANLSEKYKDYEIHFQDRYTEDPDRKASKRFKVIRKKAPAPPAGTAAVRGTAGGKPGADDRGTTKPDPLKDSAAKADAAAKKPPAKKAAKKRVALVRQAFDKPDAKAAADAAKRKAAEATKQKAAEEAKAKAAEEAKRKAAEEAKRKAAKTAAEAAEKKAAAAAAANAGKRGSSKPSLKLRLKIKVGVSLLLEIGFELFLGWLDSNRIEGMIKEVIDKNDNKFQKVLDSDKVQDDIVKFRKGEKLEKGYQLYFFLRLYVTRHCSDGGCGMSGSIEDIYFIDVTFTRYKGYEFFPDATEEKGWGKQFNGMYGGAIAIFYIPLFEKGDNIHPGTEDAADNNFSRFDGRYISRNLKEGTGDYEVAYFDEFRKYALMFPDSQSNTVYNQKFAMNDVLADLAMVELGRAKPETLLGEPANMQFHEIIEKIKWGIAGKMLFIVYFYEEVVMRVSDEWKIYYLEKYDEYFRLIDDGYTKCQVSCHTLIGDKRIIKRITADDVRGNMELMNRFRGIDLEKWVTDSEW